MSKRLFLEPSAPDSNNSHTLSRCNLKIKRHQIPAKTGGSVKTYFSLLSKQEARRMRAIDDASSCWRLVHINIQQAASGRRVRASLRPQLLTF